MNLASHYVPFLKAAPPKAIKTLGLGVVLTLTLGATGASARTADTAPPLEGGAQCGQTVKRSYSLKAVAKAGMPVTVSCDAPARPSCTRS